MEVRRQSSALARIPAETVSTSAPTATALVVRQTAEAPMAPVVPPTSAARHAWGTAALSMLAGVTPLIALGTTLGLTAGAGGGAAAAGLGLGLAVSALRARGPERDARASLAGWNQALLTKHDALLELEQGLAWARTEATANRVVLDPEQQTLVEHQLAALYDLYRAALAAHAEAGLQIDPPSRLGRLGNAVSEARYHQAQALLGAAPLPSNDEDAAALHALFTAPRSRKERLTAGPETGEIKISFAQVIAEFDRRASETSDLVDALCEQAKNSPPPAPEFVPEPRRRRRPFLVRLVEEGVRSWFRLWGGR
jgi:hypothetical protein